MKKTMLVLLVLVFAATTSFALPMGSGLQDVFDAHTVGGPSSIDVTADYLNDTSDSYWVSNASGGSVASFIIELASYADTNSFGVFDTSDRYNKVELFAGGDTTGDKIVFGLQADGSVELMFNDTGVDFSGTSFGFYLVSGNGNTYYSDTSFNDDEQDHMLAYQGVGDQFDIDLTGPTAAGPWSGGEWILAWEDLDGAYNQGSDRDFTDMVVMVESVSPVPEPATLLLLGSGLVGLAFLKRRKS